MALKLDYTDRYGNTANYLKITTCSFDFVSKTGLIIIKSYKDKATCTNNGDPVDELYVKIMASLKKDTDGAVISIPRSVFINKTVAEAYTEIKKHKVKIRGRLLNLANASDI